VCQPCDVILVWIKVYKVRQSLVALVTLRHVVDPPTWCSGINTCVRAAWRPPPLVEKLLSGDTIEMTKGLGECLRGEA
jgi:hypothetical protein